ncbi:family 31 glucosidase [Dolosicoccus paucivorans]|uniref:Family 31 glucosidase n=1 Tax=Dolosicoccus paucivorans TaxID=84521 RepID=A0A2N6SPF8_9LACT|nr:TIM-barrel domain-containing protein [Dolosicoccus paucivorans]PMC58964.1 family 31 glucosidase [Dolosicoccus paucivorans]
MISIDGNKLIWRYDDELLVIEPWGRNSVRVRSFADAHYTERQNALTEKYIEEAKEINVKHDSSNDTATLINGNIKVVLDHRNRLTFYNKDQEILKEYIRLRAVKHDDGSEDVGTIEITRDFNSTLKLKSREYIANYNGADFQVKQRFESVRDEKIFGMGQYQEDLLDFKGSILELAQRNSQMSVPFYISNYNYGFLWNNPGIGKVTFANNLTEWEMYGTNYIDYWITAGENPKEILERYTEVTGRTPKMPENLLGLWQSKLRYRTPKDVLEVVKKYKEKGIQLSTIAIDYFHWPKQGEYRFDTDFWPDPKKLVKELKEEYGVEPLISIWPTVQSDAYNYEEYLKNGYLVNVNRGVRLTMQIQGSTVFADMTNPDARNYIWGKIKESYKDIGIDYYWIDVAEPGYAVYDFDNIRYHKGPMHAVGNLYPLGYLKMIYEGNKKTNEGVVTLTRGSWAGAQKYGALAWSGDIDCSFEAFRNQVNTGLNMGLAGIPWWTTDIGGFHGGNPDDESFRELVVRWFQYSTFSPILRMHGDRLPHSAPLSNSGGGSMPTGASNEIWAYGEKYEAIMTKYIRIREILKPYLIEIMEKARKKGHPLMRPLFFEYPEDSKAWETDNMYLFGSDLLVAPVLFEGLKSQRIYLPKGEKWIYAYDGRVYEGGQEVEVAFDIQQIPLFVKQSKEAKHAELLKYIQVELSHL